MLGGHRHAEHWKRGVRGHDAGEMSRAAGPGDDGFQAALRRALRPLGDEIGRAVRRHRLRFVGHAEFSSISAAAFMVSQSEADPITMPIMKAFSPSIVSALRGTFPRSWRSPRPAAAARRRLVPVERLEIVAHVLFVERRRTHADAIRIGGPEARRIRGQDFIDQDEILSLVQPELKLRIGNDDAFFCGVVAASLYSGGWCRAPWRRAPCRSASPLGEADVLVVPRRGLGSRREDRLGQLLAWRRPFGSSMPQTLPVFW